jgi:hypothetical protein
VIHQDQSNIISFVQHQGLTYIAYAAAVQVDFVKLLMDKLMRLHRRYADSPLAAQFPRPAFKVRRGSMV